MFKYVRFEKVETEFTVLEFRGGDNVVVVNYFDVPVVSIKSLDAALIDALVAAQDPLIKCQVINQAEFIELVRESAQLKRIRDIVKQKIANSYDVADEIAISKRDIADAKRVDYEAYVFECVTYGNALKLEIGY